MTLRNKFTVCLALFLFIGNLALAQSKSVHLVPVKIGDKVPAYPLNHLVNYPKQGVKLTEFKGKILILDFWTVNCSSCLKSWPELLKLQQEFKDTIQIVLVNVYEDEQKMKSFLEKRDKVFGVKMTLPVACGDLQLRKLFPFYSVPHTVFIDKDGTVKYMAAGYYLNRETIRNMIDGKKMEVEEKTDDFDEFKPNKPLFINGHVSEKQKGADVIWTSVITPYSPRMPTASDFGRWEGTSYGWISNYPIRDMFRILYGRGVNELNIDLKVQLGQVVFKTVDTSGLVMNVNGIVKTKNFYTIQMTSKRDIPLEGIRKKMIIDLEQCFGLKTGWEKQIKKCLIISRSKMPLAEYREGEKLARSGIGLLNFNKLRIAELIDQLNLSVPLFGNSAYPLIDETNFKGELGKISFEGNVNDMGTVKEVLNKYGLDLSVADRVIDVLVISDNK